MTTAEERKLKLVPPFRFAVVCCARDPPKAEADETVYRGAYPSLRNFRFLRSLRLRTLVAVVKGGRKGLTADLVDFCRLEGVTLVAVRLGEEKKLPSSKQAARVLALLMDSRRLPAYVHCVDGGAATGALVACLRLWLRWPTASALAEFCRYVKDGAVPGEADNLFSAFARQPEVALPKVEELRPSWARPTL